MIFHIAFLVLTPVKTTMKTLSILIFAPNSSLSSTSYSCMISFSQIKYTLSADAFTSTLINIIEHLAFAYSLIFPAVKISYFVEMSKVWRRSWWFVYGESCLADGLCSIFLSIRSGYYRPAFTKTFYISWRKLFFLRIKFFKIGYYFEHKG